MICRYLNSDTEAPLDYQVIARGERRVGMGLLSLFVLVSELKETDLPL